MKREMRGSVPQQNTQNKEPWKGNTFAGNLGKQRGQMGRSGLRYTKHGPTHAPTSLCGQWAAGTEKIRSCAEGPHFLMAVETKPQHHP